MWPLPLNVNEPVISPSPTCVPSHSAVTAVSFDPSPTKAFADIVLLELIEPLKKKCNYVIGLHCNPIGKIRVSGNWKKQLERSLLLTISSRDKLKIKKMDLFWEPPGLSNYHVFDFKRLDKIFDIGYAYAMHQLSKGQSEFLINSYVWD